MTLGAYDNSDSESAGLGGTELLNLYKLPGDTHVLVQVTGDIHAAGPETTLCVVR